MLAETVLYVVCIVKWGQTTLKSLSPSAVSVMVVRWGETLSETTGRLCLGVQTLSRDNVIQIYDGQRSKNKIVAEMGFYMPSSLC